MLKPLGDRVVLKSRRKEQKVGGFVIAGAGQDATKEAKVIELAAESYIERRAGCNCVKPGR